MISLLKQCHEFSALFLAGGGPCPRRRARGEGAACRSFVLILVLALQAAVAGSSAETCPNCVAWNVPQKPFRIYGNTYYVGVQGLSAILITSKEGHVLIDGALPESAANIAASIEALGIRIGDIKLIVNSHVHFDHAGGIAELRRLSGGAAVAASPWSAKVMKQGGVGYDDPQYSAAAPIAPIEKVKVLADGETLRVGNLSITARQTPGHTPGGTSWTWVSCEQERCLNIVYADSLTAVSADAFQFTRNQAYPNVLGDFEKSFVALNSLPCDILLTPHPGFSDLMGKHRRREQGLEDAFVDPNACRNYVDQAREKLAERVARERSAQTGTSEKN